MSCVLVSSIDAGKLLLHEIDVVPVGLQWIAWWQLLRGRYLLSHECIVLDKELRKGVGGLEAKEARVVWKLLKLRGSGIAFIVSCSLLIIKMIDRTALIQDRDLKGYSYSRLDDNHNNNHDTNGGGNAVVELGVRVDLKEWPKYIQ